MNSINSKAEKTVVEQIKNEEGFGVVVNGWWYRTDWDAEEQRIVLRSGQDMMPPTSARTLSASEIVTEMKAIAPLTDWQTFDVFMES